MYTQKVTRRRPNVYKCMVGLMDISYKELAVELSNRGFIDADVSEICRAVRGFSGTKHEQIRQALAVLFGLWLKGIDEMPVEVKAFADSMAPFGASRGEGT